MEVVVGGALAPRRRPVTIDLTGDDRPVAVPRLPGAEPPARRRAIIDLTGDDDNDVVVVEAPLGRARPPPPPPAARFARIVEDEAPRRANHFLAQAQMQQALDVFRQQVMQFSKCVVGVFCLKKKKKRFGIWSVFATLFRCRSVRILRGLKESP